MMLFSFFRPYKCIFCLFYIIKNVISKVYDKLDRAEELYYLGAVRMFRFIRAGIELKKQ